MSKEKKVVFVSETCDPDSIVSWLCPYAETADQAKSFADSKEFADDHDLTQPIFIYKVTIEKIATGKKVWEKE